MKKIFLLIFIQIVVSLSALQAATKGEAKALIDAHRYSEAIATLRQLMSRAPYNRDADCNKMLGQALTMTGHYREAIAPLELVVKNNRKSGAQWYLAIARQHLYDFDGAIAAVEAYLPVLTSEMWKSRADSLLAECRIGQRALEHTQDVVIVDSLLVPRETFFSHYRLGAESGKICKSPDALYFENQASDYRIYSDVTGLAESHKFQDQWEERQALRGIGSTTFRTLDPFLRSDGETLYFACDSTPGMGGLDIYRTRYNADDGEYYQAERLGMPFNSPFDDYMMAIDETHQVGWWATERHQHADSVTIYLFLIDDEPLYLDDPTVGRARIDCFTDSWRNPDGYADLVLNIQQAPQTAVVRSSLRIIIDDDHVYDNTDQFRNPEALEAYQEGVKLAAEIEQQETFVAELRTEYASAKAKIERGTKGGGTQPHLPSLASTINQAEESLYGLYRQQRELTLRYRRLEHEKL